MGDLVFEENLTDYILRICNRLDVGILSASSRKALLIELETLVKKRNRVRKAFNSDRENETYNKPPYD